MQEIFKYGDIVTDRFFVAREDLVKELVINIGICQNTILYGNRRVGKSSLVHEAVRRYKNENKKLKHLFLFVDLSTCINSRQFINILCLEIYHLLEKNKTLKQKFSDISNFISSIRPTASMSPITGQIEYSINFTGEKEDIPNSINSALALLETVSKDHKITAIFDEFHVIAKWNDGDQVQWQIRSKMQLQKKIGYIFLGSSRKLMNDLFMKSKSALYRSGSLLHIDNIIPYMEFAKWIKQRFHSAKITIEEELIKYILDTTRSHPYYTQKLCYKIWIEAFKAEKDFVDKDKVFTAVKRVISDEKYGYKSQFESLTNNQQGVLKAIANINIEDRSLGTLQKYTGLPKTSINSSLNALLNLEEQLIYEEEKRCVIEDPFFELWLKDSL